MTGGRHRQELGESLYDAEQRGNQQIHGRRRTYDRRAAAAFTRAAAAVPATGARAAWRLPRMIAMAAAMKMVE